MSDNKLKRKMREIIISGIGGKANEPGDTWTFTTKQIAKVGWLILFSFGFILAASSRINLFRGIPFRLNVLESAQHETNKQVDKNTSGIAYIKDDTSTIRDDMKFIKELLIRNK